MKLVTHNLVKRYSKRAVVDHVSIELDQGEVVGLLGPNGAGKTTTIRAILGLIKPDVGEIRVMGHPVGREPQRILRHIGATVEGPAAYGYLSGRDNLRLCAKLASNGAEQNIERVLELVGLVEKANVKVGNYSLGMKQRLSLAQALIGDPSLLILDEPANGLDPRGMREIRRLIMRLATEKQITILLSSHLLHEVEQTCDRVAIIDKGKLVLSGSVPELLVQNTGGLEELFIELTGGEDDNIN